MPATLTVRDLMKTDITALTPGTTLEEARLRMADLGVRHLPVVDGERRLVGMVSQRDVARAMEPARAAQAVHLTVAATDVMTRELFTATPGTLAADVVEAMITRKIGSVPVVDATRHLVGLVTETDFLVIAHQALLGVEPVRPART